MPVTETGHRFYSSSLSSPVLSESASSTLSHAGLMASCPSVAVPASRAAQASGKAECGWVHSGWAKLPSSVFRLGCSGLARVGGLLSSLRTFELVQWTAHRNRYRIAELMRSFRPLDLSLHRTQGPQGRCLRESWGLCHGTVSQLLQSKAAEWQLCCDEVAQRREIEWLGTSERETAPLLAA